MTAGELRLLLVDVDPEAEVVIRAPLVECLGPVVDQEGRPCGTLILPTRGIEVGVFPLGSPAGCSEKWVSIHGCGSWAQSGRRLLTRRTS